MLPNKKRFLLLIISIFISVQAFSQSEIAILPVYNPSHIQLKVSANGKLLSNAKTISTADKDIEIEAFTIKNETDSELVIKDVAVDLVRDGRLISSKTLGEDHDISSILSLAKAGDIVRILVNGIYFRNALEKLELYTAGSFNLLYSIVEEQGLSYR